jgi:hypothetical protein
MLTASVLLFVIGLLGAFDVGFFHGRHARLVERDECRVEAWIHVARGPVYAAQFALLPNVRLAGAWSDALVALFVVDALVAAADVWVEPRSRRAQGGLPPGEYFMHVVLSVLVGAMLHSALQAAWAWRALPTSLSLEPHAPAWLRVALGVMAAGALGAALADAAALVERALPSPRPIHVSVRIPTTVRALWDVTQDHRIHPDWDHRFDGIIMLADRIETGTRMLYEKTLLGVTIQGWGRYKLHLPMKQSTFEFGSDDPRSLIRRGVGLWRYRALSGGLVEFTTSYTYEARWGVFGRLFDRLVFRPLFQRETERSFRRLATRWFGVRRPRVLGAAREGRRPERFEAAA